MTDVGAPGVLGRRDDTDALRTFTRSWTASPEIDQLANDWVQALGELEEVARSRVADVGTYSYRYVELGAVLAAVRPILAKHGLAIFQIPTIDQGDVVITTTVMHTSAQFLVAAPLRLPAGNNAQQAGSAITYGRRYSLMAVLGLGTEDDDGVGAGTRSAPTLSEDNQNRFIKAATDAGVSVAETVIAATNGRTDDPAHVYVSEVQALRDALRRASEGTQPVSQSGEGESSTAAAPETGEVSASPASDTAASPDQLRDTPDE